MKIEINKSFDIEIKGFKCTVTYDEAKYLYDELNKEFGYNAENWWENPPLSDEVNSSLNEPEETLTFNTKNRYNIQPQPYISDVPNGGYTTSESCDNSEDYLEFLKKNEVYSEGYLDYLTRLK